MAITRAHFSGSTGGRPIPVAATGTPGTTIHVAVGGNVSMDVIFMFASNVTAVAATLTVEFGGASDPGDHLVKNYSIPANSGPIPIALGQGMNAGLSVKAFSGTGSAINISGWVSQIR
jgi:hypothetical protein